MRFGKLRHIFVTETHHVVYCASLGPWRAPAQAISEEQLGRSQFSLGLARPRPDNTGPKSWQLTPLTGTWAFSLKRLHAHVMSLSTHGSVLEMVSEHSISFA